MGTNSSGRITDTDEAFERALLASVEIDDPPFGAKDLALARFMRSAASMTALEPVVSRGTARAAGSLAQRLSVGSLVSCALMAAYFAGTRQTSTARPSTSPLPAAVSVASPISAAISARSGELRQESTTATAVSRPLEARAASRAATGRAKPPAPTSRAPAPASLAEEVARLDAARTALDMGNFDGVSSLLERYELDFPNGALAREADVMAVRALTARGDSAGALRRARRFLAKYPHDLHAARVKELVSWQGLDANEQSSFGDR